MATRNNTQLHNPDLDYHALQLILFLNIIILKVRSFAHWIDELFFIMDLKRAIPDEFQYDLTVCEHTRIKFM